jgi:hypothetical protein
VELPRPTRQLFWGEEFFQHRLPFDRTSLTRWRLRLGEERLMALLQESLAVATRLGAAKPADFRAVIGDTTVQEKAITFPTDAKLMHRTRAAGQSRPRSTASCALEPPAQLARLLCALIELCWNLGDEVDQAALCGFVSMTSIPSRNLAPAMSFGN